MLIRVRWQKKHVFGSEGPVAGMGCQTLAFVSWHFPFFSFSNLQSFYCCVVLLACVQLIYMHTKGVVINPIWAYNNTFLAISFNIPYLPINLPLLHVGRPTLQPHPPFGSGASAWLGIRCLRFHG